MGEETGERGVPSLTQTRGQTMWGLVMAKTSREGHEEISPAGSRQLTGDEGGGIRGVGLSLGSGVKKMVEMTRVEVAGSLFLCVDPSGSPDSLGWIA